MNGKNSGDVELRFQSNLQFSVALELLLEVNKLHIAYGGSGLEFESEDFNRKIVDESPYELLSGTEFASTTEVLERSPFPNYVQRAEVYRAIETYAMPLMARKVREDIDQRFPKGNFEDKFPYCRVLDLLYKTFCDKAPK